MPPRPSSSFVAWTPVPSWRGCDSHSSGTAAETAPHSEITMSPSARTSRLALLLLIALLPGRLASQAPPFTVDDVLDVRGVTVGDLSDDGRWAVVTTASLRDRLGTDQSRFGDPTYVG